MYWQFFPLSNYLPESINAALWYIILTNQCWFFEGERGESSNIGYSECTWWAVPLRSLFLKGKKVSSYDVTGLLSKRKLPRPKKKQKKIGETCFQHTAVPCKSSAASWTFQLFCHIATTNVKCMSCFWVMDQHKAVHNWDMKEKLCLVFNLVCSASLSGIPPS